METHGTILIVDDDPAVLRVLELILTLTGHEVLSALDGEEALKLYAQAETSPALL